MMTNTEAGRRQRARRNAQYMVWSRAAVLTSAMLGMWPEPVRRHAGLAVLAWGTAWGR